MNKLLLFGSLLGVSCSALKPPSEAQIISGQNTANKRLDALHMGIYDGPSISHKKIKPLVFVDGRKYSFSKLINFNPNSIASTSIIKPAVSTAIYGRRGRYGVIIITTKTKGH